MLETIIFSKKVDWNAEQDVIARIVKLVIIKCTAKHNIPTIRSYKNIVEI